METRSLDDEIANLSVSEIEARFSDKQRTIMNQIVILFERICRHSKIKDLWESIGRNTFKNKLARLIVSNQTIAMVLPAFPFKNKDRNNKVIGVLPDMGEALAFGKLNSFAQQVSEIYPPDCKILVVNIHASHIFARSRSSSFHWTRPILLIIRRKPIQTGCHCYLIRW